MGRNPSQWPPRSFLVVAVAFLLIDSVCQAGSLTFLSPREVTMRHNGGPVRGHVKSMTSEEVVIQLRTGVDKSYSMSGVTSIIAADKSFQFYPAQESFDDFLARAGSIRGVTVVRDEAAGGVGSDGDSKKMIGTVSDAYARSVGMQPAAVPQASSSSGGFVQSGGFAGSGQRPSGLARLDAPTIPELDAGTVAQLEQERKAAEIEAATPKFALPGGGVAAVSPAPSKPAFALPEAGEEVLICSNPKCQKEVPGAKYGQQCPHCGIIWARQSTADAVAAASTGTGTTAPITDPRNPFARAVAPAAAQPALPPAPAVAPVAPAAIQPQGFSVENIPWWGKVLGFGASIMVLMFIMGRR